MDCEEDGGPTDDEFIATAWRSFQKNRLYFEGEERSNGMDSDVDSSISPENEATPPTQSEDNESRLFRDDIVTTSQEGDSPAGEVDEILKQPLDRPNFFSHKFGFDELVSQPTDGLKSHRSLGPIVAEANILIPSKKRKKAYEALEIPVIPISKEEMGMGIQAYVNVLEKNVGAHPPGLVKLIPPRGWRPQQGSIQVDMNKKIPDNPKVQSVSYVADGAYMVSNQFTWPRSISLNDVRQLHSERITPPSLNHEKDFWKKNFLLSKKTIIMDRITSRKSLFDKSVKLFNLGTFKKVFNNGTKEHPGWTKSSIYASDWGTCFPLCIDDYNVYSITYLHHGKPRVWYTTQLEDHNNVKLALAVDFTTEYDECATFYRHKEAVLTPSRLRHHKIRVGKVTQNENEFILSFPRGWSEGYSLGFNVCETRKFTTTGWIEYGKSAEMCSIHCPYNTKLPVVQELISAI